MLLPSLRFTQLLLLLITLPLALLTPVAMPLARAQETPSEIDPTSFQRDEEAERLLYQGYDQFKTDQYQEALQSFQAALERFRQNGDRYQEAHALFGLGLAYDYMGQLEQAIESYQQALQLYRETSNYNWEVWSLNREGEMWSLISIAKVLIAQNQTDLAIDYLRQSVEVFAAIRDELMARNVYIPSNFDSLKEPYHCYAKLLRQQNRPQEAQQVLDLVREVE
ncbi:tetratricopeptide repeat protein [Nodosilinea sp. FACHB-13]|uniref:tetratricopeptide repeat protein n=1 Tax=Cyanophyceae TaxID=3028117 RepID=UPI00168A1888|nr:tetratricopeptide repeat protein [Nodosilinea sp. FACHB-13]MBD2109262.1 tetratricopeptide repeat protein [Nodosilinea sp. FACHB-13]